MKTALGWMYALAMGGATAWGFTAPPAKGFPRPDLARIIFFHLPCAIGSTLFLTFAAYASLRYLLDKKGDWDVRASSAMEMGLVLSILTLLTGMLFARVQWGAWWDWQEVRMTSFLLVFLIVAAYFALRSSFGERTKGAQVSAIYVMAALLPCFLLIFVAPRLPQFQSLHPDVIGKGGFDPTYNSIFLSTLTLVVIGCVWIYRLRVRAGKLEIDLENLSAKLADRNRPSAPRVVEPVPLSPER